MKKQINITNPLTKEQLKNLKGGKNISSNKIEIDAKCEGIANCCQSAWPFPEDKKE
ncbi:hypothetical protein L3073_00395 [Ancylomarina sp. DW003]|nr:hypothetical protein [Ancylomarina sp. DW003]MDE5420656.1 hypothetical protein [Ancylomarina sp. DW003]